MPAIRSVAVGVDGSAQSEQALDWAAQLARLAGASLTILGVIPVHRMHPSQSRSPVGASVEDRRYMNALLDRHAKTARGSGVNHVESIVLEGDAVDGLLTFLDEHPPDLMVVGARGLSATRRILLGSVSEGVLHHATCSILVVRLPHRGDPSGSGESGARREPTTVEKD
jgi:nucleotide-binding universal stress UspA family protein